MDGATWIGLGTLLTAIVGLSLVGWQLHEQRRTMRAEFGNLYIQRYWDIDDALLLEAKGQSGTSSIVTDTCDCSKTSLTWPHSASSTDDSGVPGTQHSTTLVH